MAEQQETTQDLETPIANQVEDTPTAEPQDPLALAEARIADYDDRFKRLHADFENFRRRTAKERLELITQANADLLKDLIPVADDMERAAGTWQQGQNADILAEGLTLVQNKFKATLERKGLKSFSSIGEPFDADKHEAITQIPAPTDELKGKIIDEVEKGYTLGDKVVRYAKVVVGI